ncbi:MAG: S8 family peptidase [Candidatus Hodarchaeales archaeon]|jgi:subtilisin family serine protease
MTKYSKLLNLVLIFVLLFVIFTSKSNIILGISSSEQTIDISTITREIEVLENEILELQDTEESLYLIFFEKPSQYISFTSRYRTELNFNGLLGTTIKTTQTNLDSIVGQNEYLSSQNIFLLSAGNKGKFFPNSRQNMNTSINPSIQSFASAQVIGVDKLWELGYRGQGTTICVIDEGINASHPDFSFSNGTSRIKAVEGFVNTTYGNEEDLESVAGSHGTWVAGIAAGGGIQVPSYQGIANESWILDADVDEGPEDYLDMTLLGEIAAINWAIENGVDVINRSYGVSDGEESYWDMMLYPGYQLRLATIRQAVKQGVFFVHSAGNEGGTMYTISPDNFANEISVGATNEGMQAMATYSSRGPIWRTDAVSPDMIAPGTAVPTPAVQGGYGTPQGTSFAAPHVAGVSAILLGAMREQNLDVNPGTIKSALIATATDIGVDLNAQGAGQVNASAAYEYLLAVPRVGNHIVAGTVSPNELNFMKFPNVLQGSYFSELFSFTSSETVNVSIQMTGNLSSILTLKEQLWMNSSDSLMNSRNDLVAGKLSEYFSHDIVLEVYVADDELLGEYSGEIVFQVNSTELQRIPFAINVEPAKQKVLLYTGNRPVYTYNTKGEFLDLKIDLGKQGIVLNENNSDITPQALANYDVLWFAADNRTIHTWEYVSAIDLVRSEDTLTILSTSEQSAITSFVNNGGGLILTPFTTPLGMENMMKKWGIQTSELSPSFGTTPAQLTHFNSIGTSTEYFDASGSYFELTKPATPLAYLNQRENVVMASYDYPLGGRVVVVSGSNFITNRGYNNEINDGLEYQSTLFNNLLVSDILAFTTAESQLYGSYEVTGDVVTVSLHASTNFVPNNAVIIAGTYCNSASDVESEIIGIIPQTGLNGWYNFSYQLVDGINFLNFTLNSEVVFFEIITDKTAPVIGVSGMKNDSYLMETTEVIFWFRDDGAGIDRYSAEMTLDGNIVGYNGPKINSTGSGYFIEKDLNPDHYETGSYVIILTVSDLAGNSVSITFIFNVGAETEGTKKGTGFQWDFMIWMLLVSFVILKRSRNLREKK